MADIVNLDNHYKASNAELPDMIISSQMIVENFGGPNVICSKLRTDPRSGLDLNNANPDETAARKRVYGVNAFAPPKIKTLMELVMENFDDPINVILLIAGAVSMIIGLIQEGWPKGIIEGTSIIISLMIIISVNSGNNYMSEKRLADLVNLSEKQEVAVYRGDAQETITIDATQLLVGDVIKFESGMKVPADCIVLEGQDVVCDEGELTGEPLGIMKEPINESNYTEGGMATMLAKSLITSGTGRALVLAVGPMSVAGVITTKTQTETEPTLLQKKLETIANKIGKVGFGCAIMTYVAMIIRIILEMVEVIPCGCQNITACVEDANCKPLDVSFTLENRLWRELLDTFIICIAIIVAAIPEGLPLAVTISLSFSSKQMMKLNNLVRKLASSETMGGATHICSDKTGTLTQNKMTVMAYQALNQIHLAEVGDPDKFSKILSEKVWATLDEENATLLKQAVLWNSSAYIERDEKTHEYVTRGNVTEQGIFKFFINHMSHEGVSAFIKSLDKDADQLELISFSSSRKRASVVVRHNGAVRVYTKGAPDMLFPLLESVLGSDGQPHSVNDEVDECPPEIAQESNPTYLESLERTVKLFANKAFRTILITYRDLSEEEFEQIKSENNNFDKESDREVLETNLTAIGIFGLQDPLRPGIIESIKQVTAAGITTIMCTGDNIDTAIAISKNAGIITEEQTHGEFSCMTGKDFREHVGGLIKITDSEGKERDAVGNMKKFKEIK